MFEMKDSTSANDSVRAPLPASGPDAPPQERFDRLTRIAQRLFGVPMASISLADAEYRWLGSQQGLPAGEPLGGGKLCSHALSGDEILVVPDASLDARFSEDPLVTGRAQVRFFAGCPINGRDGRKLGTLCLMDSKPRALAEEDWVLLRDLARMAAAEFVALHLTSTDTLTGLPNRRGLLALGKHALGLCTRLQLPALMLYFDLDEFRQINERCGYAGGDRALRDFAALLRGSLRESDLVGRLGDDKFTALLPNYATPASGAALQRLRQAVDAHNRMAGRRYSLCFSASAVAYDHKLHTSLEALIDDASAVMREGKLSRLAA